jgi:hypothetical protein
MVPQYKRETLKKYLIPFWILDFGLRHTDYGVIAAIDLANFRFFAIWVIANR